MNPNIVMVVVDSFRPDHLSMFGYGKQTDTNLKRIAKESSLFTNHFSVANGTAPALTTIFSGLLPGTHGVRHQFPYTKPEEYEKASQIGFWLPSVLKERGYGTLAFDWIDSWFEKGFDYYKESESHIEAMFPPTSVTVDLAISKIRQAKGPVFGFLHLWDTHFPYPNTPYEPSGIDESQTILAKIQDASRRDYVKKRMDSAKLYNIEDIVAKYDETIGIIDRETGRLYDFLRDSGLLQDTVFMVMGDHGAVIDEHDIFFANCGLFDIALRAPLLMKFPGVAAGEVHEMVQNTDIVPTLMDYMGVKIKLDGRSLMPLIRGGHEVRNEAYFFDAFANDVTAVRTGDRKRITSKDGYCNMCKTSHHSGVEEYDLADDPTETRNIYH
jgi:arylsulfatase A-like enzyme